MKITNDMLTEWFTQCLPIHAGWYEVKYLGVPVKPFMAWFDGERFNDGLFSTILDSWRGLKEKHHG